MNIELDEDDFNALTSISMEWHAQGWHDVEGAADRFRPLAGDGPIFWRMRYAYWFADAASMILARAYLDSIGEQLQVLVDAAEGDPFVIITDYETRAWRMMKEAR